MNKEIADLRDRISSNSVSIDSFIFPSLANNFAWCIQHLPGDVDQALVCLDAPSLLHCFMVLVASSRQTKTLENRFTKTINLESRPLP
jgi:hypothetical protein